MEDASAPALPLDPCRELGPPRAQPPAAQEGRQAVARPQDMDLCRRRPCAVASWATGPFQVAILCGFDVPDTRFANVPPRFNAAPSQELWAIRQNHDTGERSLDLLRWGAARSRTARRATAASGSSRCGGAPPIR